MYSQIPTRTEVEILEKEVQKQEKERFDSIENTKMMLKNYTGQMIESLENKQNESFLNHKSETEEKFSAELVSLKTFLKQKTDKFETDLGKLSNQYSKLSKSCENDNKSNKEQVVSTQQSIKEIIKENQKLVSANNSILSDLSKLSQDFTKFSKNCEENNKKKTSLVQLEEMIGLCKEECILITRQEIHEGLLSLKTALIEDSSSIKEETQQIIRKQEQNLLALIEKKMNVGELLSINTEFSNITKLISGHASQDEVDLIRDSLEALQLNVRKKFESDNLEKKKSVEFFENIRKELGLKVSFSELAEALETKVTIDDVNKSIEELYLQIEKKVNIEEYEIHVTGQNVINEALCAENRLARWVWKSGDLINGNVV